MTLQPNATLYTNKGNYRVEIIMVNTPKHFLMNNLYLNAGATIAMSKEDAIQLGRFVSSYCTQLLIAGVPTGIIQPDRNTTQVQVGWETKVIKIERKLSRPKTWFCPYKTITVETYHPISAYTWHTGEVS